MRAHRGQTAGTYAGARIHHSHQRALHKSYRTVAGRACSWMGEGILPFLPNSPKRVRPERAPCSSLLSAIRASLPAG
jgi:hypothetical protein